MGANPKDLLRFSARDLLQMINLRRDRVPPFKTRLLMKLGSDAHFSSPRVLNDLPSRHQPCDELIRLIISAKNGWSWLLELCKVELRTT